MSARSDKATILHPQKHVHIYGSCALKLFFVVFVSVKTQKNYVADWASTACVYMSDVCWFVHVQNGSRPEFVLTLNEHKYCVSIRHSMR